MGPCFLQCWWLWVQLRCGSSLQDVVSMVREHLETARFQHDLIEGERLQLWVLCSGFYQVYPNLTSSVQKHTTHSTMSVFIKLWKKQQSYFFHRTYMFIWSSWLNVWINWSSSPISTKKVGVSSVCCSGVYRCVLTQRQGGKTSAMTLKKRLLLHRWFEHSQVKKYLSFWVNVPDNHPPSKKNKKCQRHGKKEIKNSSSSVRLQASHT